MSLRPVIGETYTSALTGESRIVKSISGTHIYWKKTKGNKIHASTFLSWVHWRQGAQEKPGKFKKVKKKKYTTRPKKTQSIVCPECGWKVPDGGPCPEQCPKCDSRHPIFDDIPF